MRNPNLHGSWIIILVLSLWSFSAAQTAPDTRPLEQGKPIERELAVGDVHAYSIQLTAGLWKVSDAATAELMKSFYQGMLRRKLRQRRPCGRRKLRCGSRSVGKRRFTGPLLNCRVSGTVGGRPHA